MKIAKQIIINILIAFLIALCIAFIIKISPRVDYYTKAIKELNTYQNSESISNQISMCQQKLSEYATYISLSSIAIAACLFIFVYCNPRLFRLSSWTNLSEEWAKNKSERAARKEAKTQADKQKRIEELQAELDELQDKTNLNS